jgi:hypothetical protein
LLWGATLGWAYQQVLVIAGTVAKPAAENVKRKWRAAFPFGIIAIPAAAIPL